MLKYRILFCSAAAAALIFLGAYLHSVFFEQKPEVVHDTVYVESTEVQTLRHQIALLQNELNAKPLIIHVPVKDTVFYNTVDTVTVYPVGSYKTENTVPFSVTAGKDSLKLDVRVNTFNYMFINPQDGRFYHTDSLQVSLADIYIFKDIPIIEKPKQRFISIISGINPQFEYNRDTEHFEYGKANFDLGLRFFDKYDVSATADTDLLFGIRLGARF